MPPDNQYFLIVPASGPEDFAVCARMMSETDPWITLGLGYEQCLNAFDGPLREIYVLKKGGKIIGFAILQLHGTFRGYIQTLCVDESNRGAGYGTRLLRFCESRILQHSPNIFICVSAFNTGALNLYIKFGFELVGELKDFIKEGFTELLLRKTVGPLADYKPRQPGHKP